MKVFEANITHQVSDFFNDNLIKIASWDKANQIMYDAFGIIHFFDNDEELKRLKKFFQLPVLLLKNQTELNMATFKLIQI